MSVSTHRTMGDDESLQAIALVLKTHNNQIYEDRSINKLQNDVCVSIFRIRKKSEIYVCRELNWRHVLKFS